MQPLEKDLDIKRTKENLDEYLKSFQRIKFRITVEDVSKSEGSIIKVPGGSAGSSSNGNLVLKKMETAKRENERIEEYLDFILESIAKLSPADQRIILLKYFYEMDDEEIAEEIGFANRWTRRLISDAEISLAYIIGCTEFKKAHK